MKKARRGFVLIELIVVFGMFAVLIGMTTLNVLGSKRTATLTGVVDTLVADLRSQQTKAMSGVTQGGVSQSGYGIRFAANQYTLFKGTAYNAGDSDNVIVPIDARTTFSSISLPDSSIVFLAKSGEFMGYATASSTLTVKQTDSNDTKTIQFNHYGVITSIN